MKLTIFGLGHVGAVVCACFSRDGHDVTGVDTDAEKVALINRGRSSVVESGLEAIIKRSVAQGRLRAVTECHEAVQAADVSIVCVGTPSTTSGDLDHSVVVNVCKKIGAALEGKPDRHIVVVRSTVLPGCVAETIISALEEASGKRAGEDFGVVVNPEFLRESTAIHDFDHPPMTVIGSLTPGDACTVAALYARIDSPMIFTSLDTAEAVKHACNAFHALKITFANEIGAMCKSVSIDSREVLRILCEDRRLNLSPAYLTPGFAFGGSCLPKDLRAVVHMARVRGLELPVLDAVLLSNESLVQRVVRRLTNGGRKRIGVLGLAFKGGTDDLRESPIVALVEALIGRGVEVRIFDRSVSLAHLIGANRRFLEQRIPNASSLISESISDLTAQSDVILLGNEDEAYFEALEKLSPQKEVLDLTYRSKTVRTTARYERVSG